MVAHQTFCKHCRDGNFVPNATKFGDIHCYKTEKNKLFGAIFSKYRT